MTELLLAFGISNTCFALLLGLAAFVASRKFNKPQLAHFLWLMVFIKLVTPPLLTVPGVDWVQSPAVATSEPAMVLAAETEAIPTEMAIGNTPVESVSENTFWQSTALLLALGRLSLMIGLQTIAPWLILSWALGSLILFLLSMIRAIRFNQLIAAHSTPAGSYVTEEARVIAARLHLRQLPEIKVTTANLSPLVWWFGGKTKVVLPESMLQQLDRAKWTWVLAHELAHVKRRDHWVRWLEWLACVLFWWNPMVWWAQRNLRITEEICCDALVLSSTSAPPKTYAKSILEAVEILAGSALRPPTMASEINSGGVLERRFKMMVSNREKQKTSLGVRALVAFLALLLLPLGFASAQDFDAIAKRLKKAVKKGEISERQAEAMLATLKKSDQAKANSDDEKRERRFELFLKEIKGAVEDGKLSREEAQEKIAAVKSKMFADKNPKNKQNDMKDREKKYYAVVKEIERAVKAGKLSKKDAESKLIAMRKELFGTPGNDDRRETMNDREKKFHAIANEIERAVKAGKLSKEEAGRKLKEVKMKLFENVGQEKKERQRRQESEHSSDRVRNVDFESIQKRIEEAVKSGRLSKEQATQSLAELKKRMEMRRREMKNDDDRKGERAKVYKERVEGVKKRIEEAVKSGRLSKEQASEAMEGLKKRLELERRKQAEEGEKKNDDERVRVYKERVEGVKKRIEEAVKSGRLSKEQAAEAMEGLKKRLEQSRRKRAEEGEKKNDGERIRERVRLDLNAVRVKIEEQVKSGRMSKEQAAKTFEDLKRQLELKKRKESKDDGTP